jgi:3-hydroxy-2-methylpyridine-4,5-dicarboxylate 4-decarboxylase
MFVKSLFVPAALSVALALSLCAGGVRAQAPASASAHASAPASARVSGNATSDPRVAGLIEELVTANRVLYSQGLVDGFGHISARSPLDANHFFMARSVAPSAVTAADIQEFDLDGKVVGNDTRAAYAERFIHSEIYKVRADVKSVVHGHAPSVIPFSITGVPLMPVYHMSGFLGTGTPVFDIRMTPTDPETDLLVKSAPLGAGLARALGTSAVVLMRGHGFTAVGSSVPVAVFRSVYTDMNAKIQIEALKLGKPLYLSAREAALTQETMERLSVRSWEMWKAQAAAGK